MPEKMTYQDTGVSYETMDPFKRLAQKTAARTAENLFSHGFREVKESRGESVYVVESVTSSTNCYLAHVEEGLGTKNLIADAMRLLTDQSYYECIAQDTVAMIVNDMATLGARPLSVAMQLAVGSAGWFNDTERYQSLLRGWAGACDLAGCAWGGGETPTLKDIILPDAAMLAGSAMGIINPKVNLIRPHVRPGDRIILIESSGIHANGITWAREIARELPNGYLTKLPDGRSFGETLLTPTPIYVPVITKCQQYGIDLHYAANITGHGWRKLMRLPESLAVVQVAIASVGHKLMRLPEPLAYVIETLPTQLPIFDFMQQHGHIDDTEAYRTFNMGAGFALFVAPNAVNVTLDAIEHCDYPGGLVGINAGYVAKSDVKKVVIQPKQLEYLGSSLGIR